MDDSFDPAAHGWERYVDDGFIGLVGPFWTKEDSDGVSLAFLAEAKHRNRAGYVQGGMLVSLADRAIGVAAYLANDEQWHSTVQLDVHFLDKVKIGEFVEARCQVVRQTRTLMFMSATIVAGKRTVASVNGIWKRIGG